MTTELQRKMIVRIAEDLHTPCNGARPACRADTLTWANTVIEDAEDRGVVRSLVNAGLAFHWGHNEDATLELTDEGFKEYNRIKDS